MAGKPVVFISSTSEFSQERATLARDLGKLYEPYLYEEEAAQGSSPQKQCQAMIKQAHVFVGILGRDYGSPLPSDTSGRSIVEWEFDTAKARARELEMLAFVKRLSPEVVVEDRQRRFLDRVRNFETGLWCKLFDSTADLLGLVRVALERWALRYWQAQQAELPQRRRYLDQLERLLHYVALGSVLAAVTLAGAQVLWQPFSTFAVVTFCALAFSLIGIRVLVLLSPSREHIE